MKEDNLTIMVSDLKVRVERLERELPQFDWKDQVSKSLDFLVGSYKRLEQELSLNSSRLSRLDDDMQVLKSDVSTLGDDMVKVKEDMAKVKVKLEIA